MAPGEYCPDSSKALLERLSDLRQLRGRLGSITPQQRGYCLERLLHDALTAENLAPRSSYKPKGEQIDGSFVLFGRTYLFEAKWEDKPMPASSLYSFKGKVDGKLVGTIGFYVSMSDFSDEAADALTLGKDVNVLLITGDDLEAALSSPGSIGEMIGQKLRHAADEGVVHAPYAISVATQGVPAATPSPTGQAPILTCVVEGSRDAFILNSLAARLLPGMPAELWTYPAHGLINAARLARSLADNYDGVDEVLVLVDGDWEGAEAREDRLKQELDYNLQVEVIVAEPTLEEDWLGVNKAELGGSQREAALRAAIDNVDVDDLRQRSPSFARFVSLLERNAARSVSGK